MACRRNKIQKTILEIQAEKEVVLDSLSHVVLEEEAPLEIDNCDVNTLKFKSKIEVSSPFLNQSFPANVQLKKDSLLWFSVAVGLEVGRAIVNKDSIFVLDRLNRKYYSSSLLSLSEKLQFDVDFNLLQSLILGDVIYKQEKQDSLSSNSLYTSLFQKKEPFSIESQIDNVSHKLTTLLVNDQRSGNSLGITYSEFISVLDELLPTTIFSKIDNKNKPGEPSTIVNIYHNKIEAGDINLKFPFNIPKSYSAGELPF